MTETFFNPHVSANAEANGTLTLSVAGGLTKDFEYDFVVVFGPMEVLGFMQQIAQTGSYALRNALRELAIGSCSTCHNLRLIQDPDKEMRWSIRCPACSDRQLDASIKAEIADCVPVVSASDPAVRP